MPGSVSKEVSMKVYINGVLDANNSKTAVPAYNTTYTLTVLGTTGMKSVVVNLDGQQYRNYQVDFDNETVKTVASYPYTSTTKASASTSSTSSNVTSTVATKTNVGSNVYKAANSNRNYVRVKNERR